MDIRSVQERYEDGERLTEVVDVSEIDEAQAEIDRLVKENKFITEGSNRALKAQQDEIEGIVDAIIDSGKYKEDAELRSIIARHRGKNVNIKALCK